MAGPININPNLNPQPGMSEESIAASAELITTGLEKELNIKRPGQIQKEAKVELKELDQYIQKLTETTIVEPVKKWDKRKKEEKEKQEEEKETPGRRGKRRGGGPLPAFKWLGRKAAPKRNVVIKVGDLDRFGGIIDANAIKDYVTSHIKASVGLSGEDQKEARSVIDDIRSKFRALKISDEVLLHAESEINGLITTELARIIKAFVLHNIQHNPRFSEWIIRHKKSGSILNYALYNEFTAEAAGSKGKGFIGKMLLDSLKSDWKMKFRDPRDLVELAKELGIDLSPWLASFLKEKINVTKEGAIVISSSLIESEWRKAVLLDEYKMVQINILLEERAIRRFMYGRRLKHVIRNALQFGITIDELHVALVQAKKIAWAKLVSHLKEAHLARVFCGSEVEFSRYSGIIAKLTTKARGLGLGISSEGLKLVEAHLTEVAIATADYKMELLKSMQKIEHDKSRDRDIKWLGSTIKKLRNAEARHRAIE